MFWLTCAPHLPAIVQEYVLRRHARAQPAGEVVADRLADAEPGLAGGDGIQHVGSADAARRAVECAGAAGVRVGIHQHGAGQRVGLVGDHRVADALVGADIVQPLDAELLWRMRARSACIPPPARSAPGTRWSNTITTFEGSATFSTSAPAFRQEREIDQAGGLDIDHGDVAGRHVRRAAGARQDLFGDRHAHGFSLTFRDCRARHAIDWSIVIRLGDLSRDR